MLARLSVALCIVWHALCVNSEQWAAVPDDETLLIQFQTTMDRRSSDNDIIMSDQLAAELLPILTKLPNMSKIKSFDPVHQVCNQVGKWISPLTSWLNITLDESSTNIDSVLNESLVMEAELLVILRNKTESVSKQLRMAELLFSTGLLPGGAIEQQLLKALAPMNLGGALHLDRYKVAAPSASGNASFYDLLMKGLVQKMRAGFGEADQRARQNATEAIAKLNASMEDGMAQMGSLGKLVGASLANFTGTLSKDMEAVMPLECASVYTKAIGDANATIDSMQRNIEVKLSKMASGLREVTELFKAIVDPATNKLIGDLAK